MVCEPRGAIHVKGKGEMEVWHVIGSRKAEPSFSATQIPESLEKNLGELGGLSG